MLRACEPRVMLLSHRHHLALGGHEGGPVAEPQLGLQGVEVDLQLTLLLHTRRLVDAAVVTEVLQLLLHGAHGLLRHAVLQPGDGAADPLQQLQGSFIRDSFNLLVSCYKKFYICDGFGFGCLGLTDFRV